MSPARPAGAGRALPGKVRIIGGMYKRTPIAVADHPGLRPTPDRVRQTLFNWLGQDLTGWHVVDAFAGTGALSFEAVSRGAARVRACEQDPKLAARITALRDKLGAQALSVVCGDGLSLLRSLAPGQEHLVLIDPPFDAPLFAPALQAALPALAEDGRIYLEAPVAWAAADVQALGLRLLRQGRAGAVHFHLLGRSHAA